MARLGNKMIYVNQANVALWTQAEERARSQGVSLSKYLARLLRRDLQNLHTDKPMTPAEKLAEAKRLSDEAIDELNAQVSEAQP